MNLIILPGNSKQFNEQWLKDSAENFGDIFETVKTHVFKHWETGDQMIDVNIESERLKTEAENLDNLVIYAKSAGVITTIKACAEKLITPKACIFVGCPFGEFATNLDGFKNWVKNYDVHTLFIQQTNDPFFKYEELEKFIEENEIKNYELIEIAGDNHAYDNYKDIKQFVSDFLE